MGVDLDLVESAIAGISRVLLESARNRMTESQFLAQRAWGKKKAEEFDHVVELLVKSVDPFGYENVENLYKLENPATEVQ